MKIGRGAEHIPDAGVYLASIWRLFGAKTGLIWGDYMKGPGYEWREIGFCFIAKLICGAILAADALMLAVEFGIDWVVWLGIIALCTG
ncbi:MAG: hypothetical protein Q8M92_01390 [Candidatus Subteraquimicrobiales bacterium]|nr:hypothetical protein [Candidatus Subteraquimicrobiales bacterium]